MSQEQALRELGEMGREHMIELIKDDLLHIRVEFDSWFSEGSLYESGEYQRALDVLRRGEYILEAGRAQWLPPRH